MIETRDEEKYFVERLKAKDEQAFKEFVNKYKDRIFSIAFGFSHDTEEAKDITQEAFIKIFESVKQFKGSSKFFTWFYRIIINICIDRQRKKKLFKVFSLFKSGNRYSKDGATVEGDIDLKSNEKESPEEILETTELGNKIKKSLKGLTMKEKEVFELKHYQGLMIKEIAEILGLSEGTIKAMLFRAVRKLQKILGDDLT